MTYWEKSWDLYICRYVMEESVSEPLEQGEKFLHKSFYLRLELFQSEDPEAAYEKAIAMIPTLNDAHRDDHGNSATTKCLGINELDLLQANFTSLREEMNELGSFHLDSITERDLHNDPLKLIRKKEELALFD